jgi:hypothetical protein
MQNCDVLAEVYREVENGVDAPEVGGLLIFGGKVSAD